MKEQPVFNREGRRYLQKKYGIKSEGLDSVNKGDCYYCTKPVMVAQGQLYTTMRGKPTHRECRLSTGID
jgi:hypothetical protein